MASFLNSISIGLTMRKAIKVLTGYYNYPANNSVAINTVQRITEGRASWARDKNEHNVALDFLEIRVKSLNPKDTADIELVKSILSKAKNAKSRGFITDQTSFEHFCLAVKQKFNIE